MVFLLYFTSAVLLVMRAFNKRKHVVWGTVKSRDAVNSSNIISSPGQVFMIISPCHGNYNVIRSRGLSSTIDFELLSSAWAFWFCIMKLKLSSIRSIKTTNNRTKDHSRSLLLHRLPLLKPAVFHIHDPLSSSKNFLVYCTLLLNCPFCEYPEDIIDFGKRHFQWNWGASNSAKVILTVSPCR